MSTLDNSTPTGYHDDDDATVRTSIEERVVKPKKKSKLFPIIFGVILIFTALVVGYMMFGYKKPATKPKAKPVAEQVAATDPASDPLAADPALTDPANPVATDPLAADPLAADPLAAQQGTAQAIDPLTGAPVAVAPSGPVDPVTGLPAVAAQQQQATDPLTGLPVASAAPSVDPLQAAAQQAQQAAPVVSQPSVDPLQVAAQQAAQQATVAQQSADAAVLAAQQQAQQQAAQQASQPVVETLDPNDPLAQFRTLLAPIDSRVAKLEKKFSGLEKTVRSIQATLGMSSGSSKKSARSYDRPRSTEIQISAPVRRVASPPVSRVIIEDGRSSSYATESVRIEAPQSQPSYGNDSCNAQAIVQGRVWIKRQDGSFVSFGEGDRWTDGSVIQSIDPARGVNAGGRWICM